MAREGQAFKEDQLGDDMESQKVVCDVFGVFSAWLLSRCGV